MLPGLRFVFAASLLAASVLVFGMGTIALLRASHQQVANLTPQPVPEPVFAQAPDTIPSLSVLRVEASATQTALVATDAGRLAALTSALRDAESITPASEPQSVINEPQSAASTAVPPSKAVSEPNAVIVDVPLPALSSETTASAIQSLRPSTTPALPAAEVTGSTPKPVQIESSNSPIANRSIAVAPLPQARPQVSEKLAALPAAAGRPKAAAVKKVRKIKRRYVRRKRISLPPVSSNPLSQLFGIASPRN